MGIAALGIIAVDLHANGLGLPSLAREPFAGTTVLGHTLRRLARCQRVDRWLLLVDGDQSSAVREIVGPDWTLVAAQHTVPSWQSLVRRGRKWSLGGWRGGVARSSLLDEECNPAEYLRLAKEHDAQWIVQVRAESPLVDPNLVDGIVDRAMASDPKPPLMYGSIPPGLGGWAYQPGFLEDLVTQNVYPGYLLGYRAWDTTIDLTEQLFAFKPSVVVSRLPYRLLADNRRSLDLLRRFEDRAESIDAESIASEIASHPERQCFDAPSEIEIELTTRRRLQADYLPNATRPDMTAECFRRTVTEYAAGTDLSLVVLAGHGDPLEHPDWFAMHQDARRAGIYGLAVATDAGSLTPDVAERLLASDVDIVHARLDAHTAKTYAAVHGEDGFSQAVQNLKTLLKRRQESGVDAPLVVVSMVRRRSTIGETYGFYDEWSTAADGAVILPHADFAGQMPADDVLNLEPPGRGPCRRLRRSMVIQSDGTVVSCSEDFATRQALGNISDRTIAEFWTTGPLGEFRRAHEDGQWSTFPLCSSCREWHRP